MASVRTVPRNCGPSALIIKLLANGWELRIQADQCCVGFGFLSLRRFPVRGWQTKKKKAWQDFIPLLEHLEERGRPSGFPKTTLLLIYPLTVFSLAVTHSCYELILIRAGSQIQLSSRTIIQWGYQHFGHHQSWLFKSGAKNKHQSGHAWAGAGGGGGIRWEVCVFRLKGVCGSIILHPDKYQWILQYIYVLYIHLRCLVGLM